MRSLVSMWRGLDYISGQGLLQEGPQVFTGKVKDCLTTWVWLNQRPDMLILWLH